MILLKVYVSSSKHAGVVDSNVYLLMVYNRFDKHGFKHIPSTEIHTLP